MARSSTNHIVRRNGIFYFRAAVPRPWRALIKKAEIKVSLQTSDRLLARARGRKIADAFDAIFGRAPDMKSATFDDVDAIVQKLFQKALYEALELSLVIPGAGDGVDCYINGRGMENHALRSHLKEKTYPKFFDTDGDEIEAILTENGMSVCEQTRQYAGVRLVEARIEENNFWRHQLSGKEIPYAPIDDLFRSVRPTEHRSRFVSRFQEARCSRH